MSSAKVPKGAVIKVIRIGPHVDAQKIKSGSRTWIISDFLITPENLERYRRLKEDKSVTWLEFQLETCNKTGIAHIQAGVRFENQRALSTVKKLFSELRSIWNY